MLRKLSWGSGLFGKKVSASELRLGSWCSFTSTKSKDSDYGALDFLCDMCVEVGENEAEMNSPSNGNNVSSSTRKIKNSSTNLAKDLIEDKDNTNHEDIDNLKGKV